MDCTRRSRKELRSGLGVENVSQKKCRPRMAEKRNAGSMFSDVTVGHDELKMDSACACSAVDSAR